MIQNAQKGTLACAWLLFNIIGSVSQNVHWPATWYDASLLAIPLMASLRVCKHIQILDFSPKFSRKGPNFKPLITDLRQS